MATLSAPAHSKAAPYKRLYRLDNAGKLYPAISTSKMYNYSWSRLYSRKISLKELLQMLLMKKFVVTVNAVAIKGSDHPDGI